MSTVPQAIEVIAPVIDMHPATYDRYVKSLADAGYVRRSGRGGGKAAVHLNDVEYAVLILGLASPQPGGAATAVRELSKLWSDPPEVGAMSFVTHIGAMIGLLAREIIRGNDITQSLPDGWTLTLSLAPLLAWETFPLPEGGKVERFYRDEPTLLQVEKIPAVQRPTIITKAVIVAAAKLFASSGERSGLFSDFPARKTPEAKNDTAAILPGTTAVVDTQSTAEPDGCVQAHPTKRKAESQGRFESRTGPHHKRERPFHEHTYSTAASAY